MPYEVTISGGAPWGFRLSGGSPSADGISVSRVTPGGKAAAANVQQNDYLLAVNHQNVQGTSLLNVMDLIKASGETINLTLLSEAEFGEFKAEQQIAIDEAEAIAAEEAAQAAAIAAAEEQARQFQAEAEALRRAQEAEESEMPESEYEADTKDNVGINNPNYVDPGMDTDNEYNKTHQISKDEFKTLPAYIQKAIKPPKSVPNYGKNVSWMHGKLKLAVNLPDGSSGKNAAGCLKTAARAFPNKVVEVSGPVRGHIRHAQYNTPVEMYSDPQIANTLISQAAAVGQDVPDPQCFGNQNIQVDTSTPVFAAVNKEKEDRRVTQSRSFQLLDTLLKYPYLEANVEQNNQIAQQINNQ